MPTFSETMAAFREKGYMTYDHVNENRHIYLGVAGGIVVGAASVIVFRGDRPSIVNTVAPVISPVFHNTVNMGGHMSKIVKNNETGQLWGSVTEAANDLGVTIPTLSRHLNGHRDNVLGHTYSIIGVTT